MFRAPEGLGDPTPIGWGVFCLYFVVAWLCFRARRSAQDADPLATLWLAMAGALLLLGLNKQLDLQLWIGLIGRWLTRVLGWYEQRFWIQLIFATVVSSAVIGCSVLLWRRGRGHLRRIPVAVLGVTLLVAFVLLRVVTFDVVDFEVVVGDVRVHELLELGGIALIGLAAATFVRIPGDTVTPSRVQ